MQDLDWGRLGTRLVVRRAQPIGLDVRRGDLFPEDLLGNGVIFAGALDGPKARILLILLRMNGASRGDIAKAFAEIGPLSR